ncbi:MAG: hypothetical protein MJ093_01800 [Saccharofermentans sp.]|nr:hypothetical protein [Saccharofermentans sp.]
MHRKSSVFLSVVTMMAMLLSISSCKAEQKSFPEFSYPEETTTATVQTDDSDDSVSTDITDNIYEISMAVPYSQQTMNRLLKLYYLKTSEIMPDDTTGASINLDYLDSITTPWIIDVINIPSEGVGISAIKSWYDSGVVPDVYLVNDLDTVIEAGYAQPLGNYIGSLSMSSSGIYGSALVSCMDSEGAYGIPLYQSFMLMYGNKDYYTEDGILQFRCSFDDFREYLEALDATYNQDEEVMVPLSRGYEFIPYITGGSYMLMDEYLSDNSDVDELLTQDIDFIDSLYEAGLTKDTDIDGSDPTITRCGALWIDSTSNMLRWSAYYPDSIYYSLIPTESDTDDLKLYASVYPLCLSTKSQDKDFAANFAAFICMDTDALMLLERLEPQIGYYPVCDSDMLWDMICDNDEFGSVAMMLRQNVQNSVYCPTLGSLYEQQVNDYCSSYASRYSESEQAEEEEPFEFSLEDIAP